ncbi:MAG TPA: nuclease-related domain-containing protein [Oligoflexus sp.]|uniref:nuclease-related domain-containing protein n=1 Tax=Oligoflexus sp. TaxID=1971216 RepID=UPI002D7F7ACE|nr:nuclease-related domain-containing protein [Oligoflexus sp.]HET9241651.1 nuclease-related domain-containing protein [Oligoflexus sp.]
MLAEKIKWLRKAQIRFSMIASDQAGSHGEQLAVSELDRVLKKLNGKAEIYQSLRVPKAQGSGKYEIDLLLVSEVGILAIEVKHWGGRLSRQKGKWLQERGQEQKVLVDPVPLNAEKVASLRHWLKRRNIAVPAAAMHSLVLLTNAQMNLDKSLKACDEVVELNNLMASALLKCGQAKRYFWQKKPARDFPFEQLVSTLDELPTWDRLELHGGRVVFGDLEYMAVPDVKASALQRKYIRKARAMIWRRIVPGLFFKAKLHVTDWSGKRTMYPLHPEAKLVFRPAGQNEKEEIAWLHVESLQLGWKDQSYYDERERKGRD